MRRFERALLRYFLPRLLACACAETISRSGDEGVKVNCFYVHILNGDQPDLVLLSVSGDLVKALRYDGKKYAIDTTILLSEIDPSSIRVSHYYGLDGVQYIGIIDVTWGRLTKLPYLRIHLRRSFEHVAQHLFNKRRLTMRRRLEVLRDVVELAAAGRAPISALDLMTHRFGYRWASHPDSDEHQGRLQFHLEMLAESEDLSQINGGFRPRGQALKTLDGSDEEDRRHNANLRVQGLLAFLTLISAIMAAAQGGVVKLPALADFTEQNTKRDTICTQSVPSANLLAPPPTSSPRSAFPDLHLKKLAAFRYPRSFLFQGFDLYVFSVRHGLKA